MTSASEGAWALGSPIGVPPPPVSDGAAAPAAPSVSGEAVAALMGLGVAEPVARRVVEQAVLRLGGSLENDDTAIDYKTRDLVGAALKNLATVENVANKLAERSTYEPS